MSNNFEKDIHDKGLARQCSTPFYQTSGVNVMSTKLRACQTGRKKFKHSKQKVDKMCCRQGTVIAVELSMLCLCICAFVYLCVYFCVFNTNIETVKDPAMSGRLVSIETERTTTATTKTAKEIFMTSVMDGDIIVCVGKEKQ